MLNADGDETRAQYSISEWWLEPYTRGPGVHQHDEDDVFYVLEGTMSFFVGGEWIDAPKGSLVIAPGGTPHDFENRTGGAQARSTSPSPGTSRRTCRESPSGSARAPPPMRGPRTRRAADPRRHFASACCTFAPTVSTSVWIWLGTSATASQRPRMS